MCACARVCACARACAPVLPVRACVWGVGGGRVCACVHVRACACVNSVGDVSLISCSSELYIYVHEGQTKLMLRM